MRRDELSRLLPSDCAFPLLAVALGMRLMPRTILARGICALCLVPTSAPAARDPGSTATFGQSGPWAAIAVDEVPTGDGKDGSEAGLAVRNVKASAGPLVTPQAVALAVLSHLSNHHNPRRQRRHLLRAPPAALSRAATQDAPGTAFFTRPERSPVAS